jgi:septal ring factor EnvC (AmiA/AmiB activator)
MTRNITLAIKDDVLERARIVAAENRTTVNAMVREFLTNIADEKEKRAERRRKLLELIDTSQGDLGPDYVWNREALYEDRLFPRHERPDLRGAGGKE